MVNFGKIPPSDVFGSSSHGPKAPTPPNLSAHNLKSVESTKDYLQNQIEPWMQSHKGGFSALDFKRISSELDSVIHTLSSFGTSHFDALEKFDDLMMKIGFVVPHSMIAEGMSMGVDGLKQKVISILSSLKSGLADLKTNLKVASSSSEAKDRSSKAHRNIQIASSSISQIQSRLDSLSRLEGKLHQKESLFEHSYSQCERAPSEKAFSDTKQNFASIEQTAMSITSQADGIEEEMASAENLISTSLQSVAKTHTISSSYTPPQAEVSALQAFWSLAEMDYFNQGADIDPNGDMPFFIANLLNRCINAFNNYCLSCPGGVPDLNDTYGTQIYNFLNTHIPGDVNNTLLTIAEKVSVNATNALMKDAKFLWRNLACTPPGQSNSISIFRGLFDPQGPLRSGFWNDVPDGGRIKPDPSIDFQSDFNNFYNDIKIMNNNSYSYEIMDNIAASLNQILNDFANQRKSNSNDGYTSLMNWYFDIGFNQEGDTLGGLISSKNYTVLYSVLSNINLSSPLNDFQNTDFYNHIISSAYGLPTSTLNQPTSLSSTDSRLAAAEEKIQRSLQKEIRTNSISKVSSASVGSNELTAMQYFWALTKMNSFSSPIAPSRAKCAMIFKALQNFYLAVNKQEPSDSGGQKMWVYLTQKTIPNTLPNLTLKDILDAANGSVLFHDNISNIIYAWPGSGSCSLWSQIYSEATSGFWSDDNLSGKVSISTSSAYYQDFSNLSSLICSLDSDYPAAAGDTANVVVNIAEEIVNFYNDATTQSKTSSGDGYASFLCDYFSTMPFPDGSLLYYAEKICSNNGDMSSIQALYCYLNPGEDSSKNAVYQDLSKSLLNLLIGYST